MDLALMRFHREKLPEGSSLKISIKADGCNNSNNNSTLKILNGDNNNSNIDSDSDDMSNVVNGKQPLPGKLRWTRSRAH